MNDAEFEREKDRVRNFFNKWTTLLGLRWWQKIDIEYFREPLPPYKDEIPHPEAIADTRCRWRYLTAHIRISLSVVLDHEYDDDQIEYIVVHELCHCLVNEMRPTEWDQNDLDHEERVVTHLAQAFLWTFNRQGYPDEEPETQALIEIGTNGVKDTMIVHADAK